MPNRIRSTLALTAALLVGAAMPAPVSAAPTPAQDPNGPQPAADSLRAFLLTFGPGEAVWERFGHNALWIHDPGAGTDIAYHYGLFDMSDEGFMLHFLQGRMLYSMGTAPAEWMVETYRRYGRDVRLQELRLTREQVRQLQAFLEWNMLPENQVYRYDYFRDNCSTRIRDALDRVTGGALHEALAARPSALTYRSQAVALTAEDPVLTTAMDLGLGPLADQPITHWELAFIPMRLRDDAREVTVERGGARVSLVALERELSAIGPGDERVGVPPNEASTRGRALRLLLVGMLVGGLLAGAGWVAARESYGARVRRAARRGLAVAGGLWGLVTGLLGVILLALWTLTDHEFAWRNENLLQTNPLALGLVVLVPLALLSGRHQTPARTLALLLAALSVIGLLIHPLPLTPQANLPIIALVLPVNAGLAWGMHRLAPRGR